MLPALTCSAETASALRALARADPEQMGIVLYPRLCAGEGRDL
jgi:hypothetical protein